MTQNVLIKSLICCRLPNKPSFTWSKAWKEMVDRVSDDNIHFGTVQGISSLIKKIAPGKSAIYEQFWTCSPKRCLFHMQESRTVEQMSNKGSAQSSIDVKFLGHSYFNGVIAKLFKLFHGIHKNTFSAFISKPGSSYYHDRLSCDLYKVFKSYIDVGDKCLNRWQVFNFSQQ